MKTWNRIISFILALSMVLGMVLCTAPHTHAEETEDDPWNGRSAVFVGDSITAGSGTTEIYYEVLSQTLGFGSVTAMGVAGSCISAASDYGQSNQQLINRYQSIPSADLIVIFMGTNDYGHETPLGSVEDMQDGSFYGALNVIIPVLVAKHPASKIVFVTPLHRYGFGTSKVLGTQFTSDSIPNGVGAALEDYVEAVKTVCANHNVSVIDLYTEFTLDPSDAEVRSAYMPDGLHPNAAGHELIAEIMESHIRGYVPTEVPDTETELVYGNKFASGFTQQNRASSRVNMYLKAGTVITLKDPEIFQWACAKTSDENSSNNLGYFPDSTWTDKETAVVAEDGWVGFVFKYRDETQVFNLTRPLSDYITITVETANSLSLRYDDHYDVSGKTVEIVDAGVPTSYKVGFGVVEGTLDDAVVALDGNTLVATGIGTAKVCIDGTLYEVTVTAAPISLLLLIGQSNMQGSEGNAEQSIVCPDGLVYSTYGDRYTMTVSNATNFAPSALTGEGSAINVNGTTTNLEDWPVYLLNEAGDGKIGPDSGFAYEWVKQTGEKVWVVNAAHGGTNITAWQDGGTQYEECVLLFAACQETLQKEIDAGHFTLSHMGYFWCQGCANYSNTAEWYVEKYLAMHNNLKTELAFGEDVTFEFGGIIPVRAGNESYTSYRQGVYTDTTTAKYHESFKDLRFTGPRVAQYWMTNNPELPDIWNVCNIGEDWVWMPDGTNGVAEYFQAHYENGTIDYIQVWEGGEPEVEWESGTILAASGKNGTDATRLRTVDHLLLSDYEGVSVNEGYQITWLAYDADKNYIGNGTTAMTGKWLGSGEGITTEVIQDTYADAVYFRIVLKSTASVTLTLDDVAASGISFYTEANAPEKGMWEQGTIASVDGTNNTNTTRLRTVDHLLLSDYGGVDIGFGYTMTVFAYDADKAYLGTTSWLGSGVSFTTAELAEKYPGAVYFRIALRSLDSAAITVADIPNTGVTFYAPGAEIPAKESDLKYEDVGSIGTWQDGTIWDGKLFVLGKSGTGAVYELDSLTKLGSLTLDQKDVLKPHANSVCFGSTYYAEGDKYPLLYVNIYNNYSSATDRLEGTCCVYRLTETDGVFSTELVQVIRIGFTEDLTLWKSKENNGDVRPYGNFVVDTDAGKLYAFVMRDADKTTRFFRFDIPTLTEGTYSESYSCNVVTLESTDIEKQFDTAYFSYLQGCTYYDGKIISAEGFNSGGSAEPALRIVDLETGTVVKTYYTAEAGLTKEPEVVTANPVTGKVYYAAADGVLRVLALPEIHTHTFAATVTAPTCTEQGYTTHTCACGDSYVDSYVDAMGHSYGEWAVYTVPTYTEKGEERRDCVGCDLFESRPVESPDSLDDIAWGSLTYRDIFIQNNKGYVDGFNNRTFSPFVQNTGTNTITTDACYTGPYSLAAFGSPSQQLKSDTTLGVTGDYFVASKVYCTRYSAGTLGVCLGSTSVGIQSVTDDFVTASGIVNAEASKRIYIGSIHSADLDGYVDDPVVVNMAIFETAPTAAQMEALYENYVALEKARDREEVLYTEQEMLDAFVQYMNEKAEAIGMDSSNFNDPVGMDNLSSASDILRLMVYADTYKELEDVWGESTYTVAVGGENARAQEVVSTVIKPELEDYYHILGGKTGTLSKYNARNLAVILEIPGSSDRLAVVVLYADGLDTEEDNRYEAARQIADAALAKYSDSSVDNSNADVCCAGAIACLLPAEGVDLNDLQILYSKDADTQRVPASITKVLTAICALDLLADMDETFTYSTFDTQIGSYYAGDFAPGDTLTYSDALYAMLLPSSNVTARAVARMAGEKLLQQVCVHQYESTVTAPTCTEQGYTTYTCTKCGDEYVDSYVDATGHTYGEWTQTKAPACTEKGSDRRDCENCDQYETREVAATGHSYTDVVTKPTCTEQGYTTHTCACGDSYVDSYVAATGHSYGNWTVTESASCTEDGQERRDCANCDHYETRVIEATGHSYKSVVTKPTCTDQGYTTHTCAKCGDEYVDSYVTATGHSYGNWTVTKSATCTEDGQERRDCDNCDHYETRVVEATGHSYKSVVTKPTCTDQGYTTHTCACGDSYVDSYVNATGHSYGNWTVTKSASCTEDGQERRDCANCDHYETRVVEATGHNYKSVVTEPTCTERGYTTHTCTKCGGSYVDSNTDASGHNWGEWVVVKEPTAEESGEKQRTCDRCGHTETESIPKLVLIYGDVNGDGTVNVKDLVLLRQYLAGWNVTLDLDAADVNGDDRINVKDVVLLRQYLADWNVTLGPQE